MTNNFQYNHLVTLRPLDFFFFGGETTFGNGDGQNYYAKTRLLPQQTTVLGVLRYLGLKHTKTGTELPIGNSFSAAGSTDVGFGYIHEISPLFLRFEPVPGSDRSSVSNYLGGPLLQSVFEEQPLVAPAGRVKQYAQGSWENAYALPTYTPKEWPTTHWLNKKKEALAIDDVISIAPRVGITKGRDGEDRQDGFYKQEVGRMQPGWRFAVLANLDEDLAGKIKSPVVVPFGAEKALCSVEITPLETKAGLEEYFPKNLFASVQTSHLRAAALLSDAFVKREELNALPFVVAGTVDFRYIHTPTSTTRFGLFNRSGENKPGRMTQSGKYTLLARGSLLFAKTEEALEKCLETGHEHWQTIGYNHYHLL